MATDIWTHSNFSDMFHSDNYEFLAAIMTVLDVLNGIICISVECDCYYFMRRSSYLGRR